MGIRTSFVLLGKWCGGGLPRPVGQCYTRSTVYVYLLRCAMCCVWLSLNMMLLWFRDHVLALKILCCCFEVRLQGYFELRVSSRKEIRSDVARRFQRIPCPGLERYACLVVRSLLRPVLLVYFADISCTSEIQYCVNRLQSHAIVSQRSSLRVLPQGRPSKQPCPADWKLQRGYSCGKTVSEAATQAVIFWNLF